MDMPNKLFEIFTTKKVAHDLIVGAVSIACTATLVYGIIQKGSLALMGISSAAKSDRRGALSAVFAFVFGSLLFVSQSSSIAAAVGCLPTSLISNLAICLRAVAMLLQISWSSKGGASEYVMLQMLGFSAQVASYAMEAKPLSLSSGLRDSALSLLASLRADPALAGSAAAGLAYVMVALQWSKDHPLRMAVVAGATAVMIPYVVETQISNLIVPREVTKILPKVEMVLILMCLFGAGAPSLLMGLVLTNVLLGIHGYVVGE